MEVKGLYFIETFALREGFNNFFIPKKFIITVIEKNINFATLRFRLYINQNKKSVHNGLFHCERSILYT